MMDGSLNRCIKFDFLLTTESPHGYLSSVENDSEAADTAIHINICQTEKLSKILHTI